MAVDTAELSKTWESPKGLIGQLTLVDHKTVGLRLIITAFVFLVLGGFESLLHAHRSSARQTTLS